MATGKWWSVAALAVGLALSGCGRDEGIPLALAGNEADGEFVPVDYELTSDTYKKWLVAQENLARDAGDADLGMPAQRVLLTNPSAGSIDSVVDELESVEQTKRAIEAADLSVRDFVLATLALYQATDRPDTLALEPGGVPIRVSNVELARTNAEQITAVRASSPVRFVDDRPRARGNGKGKKGKGKGRGKGKD